MCFLFFSSTSSYPKSIPEYSEVQSKNRPIHPEIFCWTVLSRGLAMSDTEEKQLPSNSSDISIEEIGPENEGQAAKNEDAEDLLPQSLDDVSVGGRIEEIPDVPKDNGEVWNISFQVNFEEFLTSVVNAWRWPSKRPVQWNYVLLL